MAHSLRSSTRTVLVAFALLAAACGGGSTADSVAAGDIPDNQVYVAYGSPAGGFSVKVPEGWARTETGGMVTFSDKFNSVRVGTVVAAAAPTVQSAARDELPAIGVASSNVADGSVSSVARSAGPVVLITYQADGAPDSVTAKRPRLEVERYEFWKDRRTVILTLSGAVGADNVDPWRTVTDSFRWV